MFSNVVVPLDGSEFSESALPWARTIALRAGGILRLVRVHLPVRVPTAREVLGPRVEKDLRRMGAEDEWREAEYLHRLGERIAAVQPAPEVTTALLRGPTVAALAEDARETKAALVVMSTHLRNPVDRALLGSVADGLVRQCPLPVLMMHGSDARLEDEEPGLRRILVALDGTEHAERVLGYAREMARLFGAALTLLRVTRPDRTGAAREEALAYLESVAEPLRSDGLDTDVRVDPHQNVPAAIASASEASGADMVALASHCRSGIPRLVLGNTAVSVLGLTDTPLLVVGVRGG